MPLWGGVAVPLCGWVAVPLCGPVAVPDCVALDRAEPLDESGVRSVLFVQAYPPSNAAATHPAAINFFIGGRKLS